MVDKKQSPKKIKKFYKSRKDRMIDGVCAGLAEYLGADVKLIRILWALSIFVNGVGLVAYILAMILVPVNPIHKNLKEEELKKGNAAFIFGVVLILLGLFFLHYEWELPYRWGFPMSFRFFRWWGIPWDILWPIGLVALGVVYIVFVLQREKRGDEKTSKGKLEKGAIGHKLHRTQGDKLVGGVCSGIGHHFNVDPSLIRIGFAGLALFTNVFLWVIIYVILLILLPQEK